MREQGKALAPSECRTLADYLGTKALGTEGAKVHRRDHFRRRTLME